MGQLDLLKCKICGGVDYRPLIHLVVSVVNPSGVDMVTSPKAQCVKCHNTVDTNDRDSIKALVDGT